MEFGFCSFSFFLYDLYLIFCLPNVSYLNGFDDNCRPLKLRVLCNPLWWWSYFRECYWYP